MPEEKPKYSLTLARAYTVKGFALKAMHISI
jgi:hypothetical protein